MTTASPEPFSTWSGARLLGRAARSIPFAGAFFAALTLPRAIRRKGPIGGVADAGLDAVPFVGAAKNVIEVVRGQDFFPDRAVEDLSSADEVSLS